MNRRDASVWISLIVAALLATSTVPAMAQSPARDMDQTEAAVLQELNLARTNPAAYAGYVEQHKRDFKNNNMVLVDGLWIKTVEGIPAADEAIGYLRKVAPAPALSASGLLVLAARDHVNDIGPKGMTGPEGSDGRRPTERIRRHGKPKSATGENIAFRPATARSIVVQLIVDDGVPDRSHRHTIFDPDFRVAGVAIGPHKNYGRMCVIDFADQMD
ncbi:MAG: CAP domain-containing protein [candidate division NC10 bacterium]|nr:CAP domain-containing protein [candidate division NC10 bacterium]